MTVKQTYNPALSFEEFETLVKMVKTHNPPFLHSEDNEYSFTKIQMYRGWNASMSVIFKHVKDIVADIEPNEYKRL